MRRKCNREEIAKAAKKARVILIRQSGRLSVRAKDIPEEPRLIIDLFLVKTHSYYTIDEQSSMTGLSAEGIRLRRQRLYAEGRIQRHERRTRPVITDADRRMVTQLFANGMSRQAIATFHGISIHRVRNILKEAKQIERSPFYTGADVERLFTVSDTTVVRWINLGWLNPGKSENDIHKTQRRWSKSEILDFVRLRRGWVAWSPCQITDPEIRSFAEMTRNAEAGRWWTVKEISCYLGVPSTTLFEYIKREGYLSGVETVMYHSRFFWLTTNPPPLMRRASAAD